MSIKLNLGCGSDIRLGYSNIDANPALASNKDVIMADARFLDPLLGDYSVDEICMCNLLSELTVKEVINGFKHWHTKMKSGGKIFVQNIDYSVVCNSVVFERCSNPQFNEIIFGANNQNKSAWTLSQIIEIMKQIGFTMESYGIKNNIFYIEAMK